MLNCCDLVYACGLARVIFYSINSAMCCAKIVQHRTGHFDQENLPYVARSGNNYKIYYCIELHPDPCQTFIETFASAIVVSEK